MKYGLIGEKLSHSFSKEIHEKIENYEYILKEIPKDELSDFMIKHDFDAINVTIPYKEAVMKYIDSIDDKAKLIGAVNTVVNKGGKLYGYNTDFTGMESLFIKAGINPQGKKVLILGSGGTSKTAKAVMAYMGASVVLCVSRSVKEGCITYDEMYDCHRDAEIIINTTPCGMFPKCFESPVDISEFNSLEGVIDAIYNPLRSKLVIEAQKRGIKAEGGLYMLASQALFAAEKFTDKTFDKSIVYNAYGDIFKSKENIVLTGMPGCGKSTVSIIISSVTNREYIDTDSMIVEKAGTDINTIFKLRGEEYFRELETECIKEASSKSGCVIATGGGAILKDENMDALRQNGRIYFIDRPLESLIPTDDRPLASDCEMIKKRYEERYSRYISTSDEVVDATGSAQDVADLIVKMHLSVIEGENSHDS